MAGGKDKSLSEYGAARLAAAGEATAVADRILEAGVRKIDALFGPGHAKATPALLAAYLEAAADIFQTDITNVSEFDDLDLDLPMADLDRRR